jgi:hypothetical protein
MAKDKKKVQAVEKSVPQSVGMPCILAFLFPGAGHLYLKKYVQAAVFFIVELTLLVSGWLMQGEMHSLFRENAKEGFLQLAAGIGNLAMGALHFVFHFAGLAQGNIEARTYEYGTTFIIIAALINMLVILNAYDIARGEKK